MEARLVNMPTSLLHRFHHLSFFYICQVVLVLDSAGASMLLEGLLIKEKCFSTDVTTFFDGLKE